MDCSDASSNSTSEEEDEVTFLLRLKPTPTPPIRRKFQQSTHQHSIKGWDVVVEKRDFPPPPFVPPAPPMRRYSLDAKRGSNTFTNTNTDLETPPLPPKYLPSAPPQDLVENLHWYPKPYYPGPYYIEQNVGISTDYPNLRYSYGEVGYYTNQAPDVVQGKNCV